MSGKLSHFELSSFAGSRIDASTGVIQGVAVITMGALRPGDRRTYQIDRTTLEQVKTVALAYPGGLKVKLNHDGTVADIIGVLRNFRIDGLVLRADLHLLTNSLLRAYVIEIAEKMPESFGLSISAAGVREMVGAKEFLRCDEIYSCDLVDEPAGNHAGLFDVQRASDGHLPDFPMTKEELSAAIAASITAALAPISERLTQLETGAATNLGTIKADLAAQLDASQEKLATKLISTFKLGLAPGAAAGASGSPAAPVTATTFTKFEEVILDLKKGGKKHNEAVELAMKSHNPLYKDYLARCGRGEVIRF